MRHLVVSKNTLFFYFLIFGYLFGVIFYDYLKFDFTDESMAAFLVLFAGITVWERKDVKELRPLFLVGAVFFFYVVYSLIIKSNLPQAILKDMVIQIKPFIGFFCTWLLMPSLTKGQRRFTCILCILVACLIVVVYLTGNLWTFFGHPSRLATSAIVSALFFLYCSSFTWTEILIFILILTTGMLSTRSKFYGFWAVALILVVFIKLGGEIKLNIKTIVAISVVLVITLLLTWQKIAIYYIDGAMNSREMWSRPAMMVTALLILLDYFPFGSGLASFGTHVSGEYYSKTYAEYNIDKLYGLSKEYPSFIADAFYPELAQFGVVGLILFCCFWFWVVKKGVSLQNVNPRDFFLVLAIFIFFLIEGIADATFTHNRGLFILILLGMILPPYKYGKKL